MNRNVVQKTYISALFLTLGLSTASQANIKNNELNDRNPDLGGGKILLYTTAGEYKGSANVGALPDMVKFLPSGNIICANEGEPADDYAVDPKGSISIVKINRNRSNYIENVSTLYFDNINIPQGVRIKPGASPAEDLEPEYIAVSEDGSRAWVTLQENNALAIVDIQREKIIGIKELGIKTFDRVDIDSKDGAQVSPPPKNIYALYQPDTVATYRVGGKDYIVTANEGDDREYEAWVDYEKASKLSKKSKFSAQLQRDILDIKGKKKLRVLRDLGKNSEGTYTQLYLTGGRSFSIWDGEGNLIFDSGSEFEEYLSRHYPDNFNTRVDDTKDPDEIAELDKDGIAYEMIGKRAYYWEGVDARSQKKGCEPEALALAQINNRVYAYIGLEKQGGFFTYDITNPKHPKMIDYFNDIDYSALPSKAGDLAPEGTVTFVQDGQHYLAVANELSGTVATYRLGDNGIASKLASLPIGNFDKGAAEIIDYDPAGKRLFVTNAEDKTVDIIDIQTPETPRKVGSINFSAYADGLQSVSVKDGLVAIAVE
nr:hypothetical protein [uncultured Desulfobulbus sp.]